MTNRLDEIKARWATDAIKPSAHVAKEHIDYLLSLLDRPVGGDSREVAREIVSASLSLKSLELLPAGELKTITDAIAAAIEAARPKASEDDERAADQLITNWHDGPEDLFVLARRIAADRAAVRQAERDRIREAINRLWSDHVDCGLYAAAIIEVIDGQATQEGN